MELVDYELEEIQKLTKNLIDNSKLITCMKSLVRLDIEQTNTRQISINIRFPLNYPLAICLIELKSKTLSTKLLSGLTALSEQKAKEQLGKPQIMHIIKFINNYLKENPLCIVYDELNYLKKLLLHNNNNDDSGSIIDADGDDGNNRSELKLKQKLSQISLKIYGGKYYYNLKISVPEDYPKKCISWSENSELSNLPQPLKRYLHGQAKEIARQCVEAPLLKKRTTAAATTTTANNSNNNNNNNSIPTEPQRKLYINNNESFNVRPSLQCTVEFLITATRDFHIEQCPICNCKCLPDNPDDIVHCDTDDKYIERVYCGHLYHQGCLKRFMRSPPFPDGGKLCPAIKRHPRSDDPKAKRKIDGTASHSSLTNTTKCSVRLSHDRWGLNIKLAEARWAQQQARERELEEVIDFLQ